ncbi:hypothetical protein LSH36_425g01028 [Paralvinella palmiformis]|uniref:PDZ domain-containing protein n=1 Tax=Paralvinella palmiformis TaxID=53620 RepID=A0AAD9JD08_9ANNE|nr:hypothetical protein LSH36_425g01028 [Paralvinella palmiformis]
MLMKCYYMSRQIPGIDHLSSGRVRVLLGILYSRHNEEGLNPDRVDTRNIITKPPLETEKINREFLNTTESNLDSIQQGNITQTEQQLVEEPTVSLSTSNHQIEKTTFIITSIPSIEETDNTERDFNISSIVNSGIKPSKSTSEGRVTLDVINDSNSVIDKVEIEDDKIDVSQTNINYHLDVVSESEKDQPAQDIHDLSPPLSVYITGLTDSKSGEGQKKEIDSSVAESNIRSVIGEPSVDCEQNKVELTDRSPDPVTSKSADIDSEIIHPEPTSDVSSEITKIEQASAERETSVKSGQEKALSEQASGQQTIQIQTVSESDLLNPEYSRLQDISSSLSDPLTEGQSVVRLSSTSEDKTISLLTPKIQVDDSCDSEKREQVTDVQLSNYLNQLDMEYFKPRSRSLRDTSDGSNVSSRRSSISEGGSSDGSRRAPPLPNTPRRPSLVDEIHMKRQETVTSSKLHGLQLPSRQNSSSSSSSSVSYGPNLPVIAKTPILPILKPGERRTGYQPLLPRPFRTSSYTSTDGGQSRRYSATLPLKATAAAMNSFRDEDKENLSNTSDNDLKLDLNQKWRSGSLSNLNSDEPIWTQKSGTRTEVTSMSSHGFKSYTPTTPFSMSSTVTSIRSHINTSSKLNKDTDKVIGSTEPKLTQDVSTSHDVVESHDEHISCDRPALPEMAPPVDVVISQPSSLPANIIKPPFRDHSIHIDGTTVNEDHMYKSKLINTACSFSKSSQQTVVTLPNTVQVCTVLNPSIVSSSQEQQRLMVKSSAIQTKDDTIQDKNINLKCESYSEQTYLSQSDGITDSTIVPTSTDGITDSTIVPTSTESVADIDNNQDTGYKQTEVNLECTETHSLKDVNNSPEQRNLDVSPVLPSSAPPPLPAATGDLLGLGDDVCSMPPMMPTAPPPGALNASGSFDSLLDLPHKSSTNSHTDSGDELDTLSRNLSPRRPESKSSLGHSREDLFEEHGSYYDSPVAPLSPTPSDADSGIYSTKTDHKSDLESLASKDTSPSGTWKSDRFSSLLKSDKVPKSSGLTDGASEPSSATVHNEPNKPLEGTIEVEFEKGNLGLGFCIEGGKGSPLGDTPVQNVLKPGDEIITVNGTDISSMSKFSAWNYLKSLPLGIVKLQIKRK